MFYKVINRIDSDADSKYLVVSVVFIRKKPISTNLFYITAEGVVKERKQTQTCYVLNSRYHIIYVSDEYPYIKITKRNAAYKAKRFCFSPLEIDL